MNETKKFRMLGGGYVIGIDANANCSTASKESVITEKAMCVGSHLKGKSVLAGNSKTFNSVIIDSYIGGNSVLTNSRIYRSDINANANIANSKLSDCNVEESNDSQIDIYRGTLEEVTIGAYCTIVNDSQDELKIQGVILSQMMDIRHGIWIRAPRYFEVMSLDNVLMPITECQFGNAHIACQCKPMKVWQKHCRAWARAGKWSEETMQAVYDKFNEWA